MRSLAAVASGCAVVVAACGSSGSTGYHNPKYPYGAPNVPVSLSKCMRANGVSSFPDPRSAPGGGGVGWPGGLVFGSNGRLVVMGQLIAGPAVAHAEDTCKEYLPSGGPPPEVSESQRASALAAAACMRSHGVPAFPDPTFKSGQQSLSLPPGSIPSRPRSSGREGCAGSSGRSGRAAWLPRPSRPFSASAECSGARPARHGPGARFAAKLAAF